MGTQGGVERAAMERRGSGWCVCMRTPQGIPQPLSTCLLDVPSWRSGAMSGPLKDPELPKPSSSSTDISKYTAWDGEGQWHHLAPGLVPTPLGFRQGLP